MGMSSDAHNYESGPTCGQNYATEPEIHVTAPTTKNVTWTPLLRDITLGLRALDTDKSTNVRVKADAKDIKPDGATIDVTTWHDTKMYWADANYIAWGKCDTSLEFGTLDSYKEGTQSKKVKLERCYDAPPPLLWYSSITWTYRQVETHTGSQPTQRTSQRPDSPLVHVLGIPPSFTLLVLVGSQCQLNPTYSELAVTAPVNSITTPNRHRSTPRAFPSPPQSVIIPRSLLAMTERAYTMP